MITLLLLWNHSFSLVPIFLNDWCQKYFVDIWFHVFAKVCIQPIQHLFFVQRVIQSSPKPKKTANIGIPQMKMYLNCRHCKVLTYYADCNFPCSYLLSGFCIVSFLSNWREIRFRHTNSRQVFKKSKWIALKLLFFISEYKKEDYTLNSWWPSEHRFGLISNTTM